MRTFTLTFNEKGEIVGGNSLSLGNIRQYSSNTYFLRVVIPSSLSATLSVNIERPDGEVATYAVPFTGTDYIIPIPGWVTDFAGEVKITLRGTATSGQATLIYVYGLATLYCEYAVKPTDYTPSDTPGEYDYLITLINSKVNKATMVNNKPLNTSITLSLADFVDDVGYATDAELASAIATRVPTTRTINTKPLSSDVVLKISDLDNDSGYLTSANLDDYALESDIPTAVSELTNDSNYQTNTDLAGVFKGSSFTYNATNGDLSLSFTKFDNTTTTPTVINLPTELIVTSGSYDDETKELVLVLANNTEEVPSEIRIPIDALYNTYFGDDTSIEGYVDTLDGNKDKFRIKAQWVTDNIDTKLAKTGDGKDVTITFTVPTEYVAPTTGDSLAVIIGKITKKLNDLGDLAYVDTITSDLLPEGTVIDQNYVATENNFTTTLKTAYDDAVTKAHTHTNKTTLDSIEGILTEIPAVPGATEGHLATVGALRALYENPDLSWDGDADTLNGYPSSILPDPGTVVVRDVEGFISANGIKIGNDYIIYEPEQGTFALTLGSFVRLQIGQEIHYYGKASQTITNGQVVQFVSVQGDHILFKPAVRDEINANPELILGVATVDILEGDFGYITHFGYVNDIVNINDPTAILYYDSSSTTPGLLTQNVPLPPNVKIQMAVSIKSSTGGSSNGRILVRPTLIRDTYTQFGDNISTNTTFNNGIYANKVFLTTNTSAITLTIPTDATFNHKIGTQIAIVRNASGTVTFSPASGVTLLSTDTKRAIKGIYSSAVAIKQSANTWYLLGSLE
jgi:hypothetical protein